MILLCIAEDVVRAGVPGISYRTLKRDWLKSISLKQRQLTDALFRLEHSGYIERTGTKDAQTIQLTNKGRRKIKTLAINAESAPRRLAWDGKWHLIMFDVAESHRLGRDLLRRKLHDLGCVQLQRSVFIYPYSLRRYIEQIRFAYDLRTDLCYAVVESIDGAENLQRLFRLRNILLD